MPGHPVPDDPPAEVSASQARAYALLAAAHLAPPASPSPHPDNVRRWERTVLATAGRFTHYITNGSEDPQK